MQTLQLWLPKQNGTGVRIEDSKEYGKRQKRRCHFGFEKPQFIEPFQRRRKKRSKRTSISASVWIERICYMPLRTLHVTSSSTATYATHDSGHRNDIIYGFGVGAFLKMLARKNLMLDFLIKCRPRNSEISSRCQTNAFSSSGKVQEPKWKIKRFAITNCCDAVVQGNRLEGYAWIRNPDFEFIRELNRYALLIGIIFGG